MPRNMSFSATTEQIRNRTKTVTRRVGWEFLKEGDVLNACVKCQGLKLGEKVERLCQIRVVSVRREPLSAMNADIQYGFAETAAEGFPPGHVKHFPSVFVEFYCRAFGVTPQDVITRIEFDYL